MKAAATSPEHSWEVMRRPGELRWSAVAIGVVGLVAALATAVLSWQVAAMSRQEERQTAIARLLSGLAMASSQEMALSWRSAAVDAPSDAGLQILVAAQNSSLSQLSRYDAAGDADLRALFAAAAAFRRLQEPAAATGPAGDARLSHPVIASVTQKVMLDHIGVALAAAQKSERSAHRRMQELIVATGVVGLVVIGLALVQWYRTMVRLRRAGYQDRVTGLPNRRALQREITLATAREHPRRPAAILLDLDDFKDVNDSHGHLVGDHLLAGVAQRLRAVVGRDGTAGRLGGDEFAVVVRRGRDPEALAHAIAAALHGPFEVDGVTVSAMASIGVNPASDDEDPLTAADVAMYEAKRHGKGAVRVFTRQLADVAHRQAAMRSELRLALERGEIWVAYQPIVDVSTGSLSFLEALARWEHPVRGAVPPAIFIPMAESLGIVADIDRFVLRRATVDAALLSVGVSVNISAQHLASGGVGEAVAQALADSLLPPRQLIVEVTESAMTGDVDIVSELHGLRRQGVLVAMDDFGTGHSSLSRLADLPVDVIKVDRSFLVRHSEGIEQELLPIVAMIGQRLKLRTVVEGIETPRQLKLVRDLGFDLGQGFVLGRPHASARAARAAVDTRAPLSASGTVGHPVVSVDDSGAFEETVPSEGQRTGSRLTE